MTESLSEVSSSMEGLEATEEGKKKSKFKAFKNFFGKKKKKEPEEVSSEAAGPKPRFSSSSVVSVSSLQPVLETQATDSKPKRGMGAMAITHDSVFRLDSEPEKAPGKLHSSPEPLRSRSRKIQSLRSRELSTSPLITRSEKVSQDLDNLFTSDRTPKSSRRRSSHCSSTPRKSFSELSSDPELSQSSESSAQRPPGFSTPATSQGCLDSSAAKYKITLSPRNQKKKLSSITVKVNKEEELYPVSPKEKTTKKTKQVKQKEQRLDSPGFSSQEQSYNTETQDKTTDETVNTDAASSCSTLGNNSRRCRRKAKNEWRIIEKGLLKSTQGYNLSTKVELSANEEMAGREHSFLQLFLEKKGTGQPTTTEAEITNLQERPSDKGDVEKELADIDVEAQRAPAPQPTSTNVAESVISGLSPCREHGPSEGKKKKDKAPGLQQMRKSISQEEATISRREEAQVHMYPSQVCGEEAASIPGMQKFQPQMELSLESTTYHKEKHPRSGFQALSTNVSSATSEDDASIQMMPLPLRRWPNTGEISSDSKSTSEYESSSEMQLGPAYSFQLTCKPKDATAVAADKEDGDDDEEEGDDEEDDDDVFLKSENIDVELSKMESQQPLRYSSQSLGKSKASKASAELESSSEDEKSCEEMTSAHSFQSLEEFEECSESRSFIRSSASEEQPATRYNYQALQELEEKESSTESSSYVEKYHSSEDLGSSEEVQQEFPPVSESSLKQLSAPGQPVHPIYTSPPIVSSATQQQPPILVNISVGPNQSIEPLPPTHTVKSWASPQSKHQVFAETEGVAADWDIFMQSVSPRKALKGYHVEQNVPSSSDIVTMEEGASMEVVHLRHHSQPPTRPRLEQEVSVGSELTVFEESSAARPSGYPPQPSVRPGIKKEISLGTESAAVEGGAPLESPPPWHHSQPLLKPFIQQQVSAHVRSVSMDPKFPTQYQPQMKPQGKQTSSSTPGSTPFEGSTPLEGSTSMERMALDLSQPRLQPYQEVPLESKTVAAKMISMGQLHSTYSAHPLPSHQSQPVPESTSIEDAILKELPPPPPSVTPKFQPLMTQDPVSTSTQWSSPMEPASAKHIFQTQANPKFKQVSVGSDSPEAQGSIPMQPVLPRCPPQPWVTSTFEQISVPQGSVPAAWAIPIYSSAPRIGSASQSLMESVVKQPVSRGPMNTSVPQIITVEPKPSRYSLQPWQSSPFEQVSVPPDQAVSQSIPIDPPAPRITSQPLMGSVVKQPTSKELTSISVPQSSSLDLLPSRFPFQPRADPECYVAEGVTTLRRLRRQNSQPPVTPEFKDEVSPGSLRASGEQSIPVEPMPPRYAPQPISGPEGVAKEGDVLREAWLSRHSSQTSTKHKVEKAPSSFESTSMERGILWMSQPSKHPTPLSIRSKVQEISSRLESATAQESSKKPQNIRVPSQSFVKFMAQQVFSESAASEMDLYSKPFARGRRRPSRSLLKPKFDEHVFLYNWDDEPKKDTTLKNLLTKQPFQLSRRPKERQEVLPFSEGASVKRITSTGDVSQPLGKLEYKQKVSVSVGFPDEWKRSEGQLPSTQSSQACDMAELQPPVLPSDSANVPVEWRISEGHQSPDHPPQSFLITDYQQVYVNSANAAAAEGAIPERLKGPASTKNVKYQQGYKDFTKSIPTSVTKPATLASARAQKPFVSMDTYFKDEVPQCCYVSGSSSLLSTSKADVENVFGVRLRRTSKKIGMENPAPCNSFVPVSAEARKEQANKGALQGSGGGPEKTRPAFSFEEKQVNRSRHEGTLKKSAVYRPPEKTSSWKANSSMEPAWITMAKQHPRGCVSHFLKKSKTRSEISAETKEPRYGAKYNLKLETVPKESEPITDILPKMTFLSTSPRNKMPQTRQFMKAVAFDSQKLLHPYTRERETRRSSSLPSKFLQPEEPEWFSVAKKKAQAWSQMAYIIH